MLAWQRQLIQGEVSRRARESKSRRSPGHLVADELSRSELGDRRLDRRLRLVAEAISAKPKASLPGAARTDAELTGMYRLLNNDDVDPQDVLSGHYLATGERAAATAEVLVLHDTTTFQFEVDSEREALGHTNVGRGFFGHFSLVVDGSGVRKPLGLVNLETWFRESPNRKEGKAGKRTGAECARDENRESLRWDEGVDVAEERLPGVGPVHVMDREADSFRLLAGMATQGRRFIVRITQRERVARADDESAWSTVAGLTTAAADRFEREVPLSPRRTSSAPRAKAAHPARKKRLARLAFATTSLVLRRPSYLGEPLPKELPVNVVRVYEPEPPDGQEPVEWWLVTQESVATSEETVRVVDHYRTRWLIEEYFKALKTGCGYKFSELESRDALLRLLAISAVIAYSLLLLRHLSRHAGDLPALDVLTDSQLHVLRSCGRRKLSAQPTVSEALLAIAALGGHLKHNGDPGWEVIENGLERLLLLEEGWLAANASRSDQS